MREPRLLICSKRNTDTNPETGHRRMRAECIKKNCDGVFRAQPIFKCFEDLERKLELIDKQKEEQKQGTKQMVLLGVFL